MFDRPRALSIYFIAFVNEIELLAIRAFDDSHQIFLFFHFYVQPPRLLVLSNGSMLRADMDSSTGNNFLCLVCILTF